MLMIRQGRFREPRRGVILLVVLTMLTLFALIGVTFVLVASAQETSARIAIEAEKQFRPQVDPEGALAVFLGQLLYDVNDDETGALSALRGQSLSRNAFGYADGILNDKPYNGTGRLHNTDVPPYFAPYYGTVPLLQDEISLVNYQLFSSDTYVKAGTPYYFLRDPERPGFREAPTISGLLAASRKDYIGGFNVPYTYPDHNNFFLAKLDPTSGQVVVPSFHRDYLFGPLIPADSSSGNPNLQYPVPSGDARYANFQRALRAKYLTLRPSPAYHASVDAAGNVIAGTRFPDPIDRGGDVKNLDGAPGGCDSIWIDIGAPVMTAPDGTKYKMLVAPLILELDNRINFNVAGNWGKTSNKAHRSNQGWGPWEINPGKTVTVGSPSVTYTGPLSTNWQNLFQGTSASGMARVPGRYDDNTNRSIKSSASWGGTQVRGWAQVDYNGMLDGSGNASERMILPGQSGAFLPFVSFPKFPTTTFANGNTGGVNEFTDHPANWRAIGPTAPNRLLPLHTFVRMLRNGGTGADMLSSDLVRLFPDDLINSGSSTKNRNLITLLSADLDRPGATPFIWNSKANGTITTEPADAAIRRLLLGVQNGIPTLVTRDNAGTNQNPIPFPLLATYGTTAANLPKQADSEFDLPSSQGGKGTWRSVLAKLGRIKLNRGPGSQPPLTDYKDGDAVANQQADKDRREFAKEIFNVLRQVTGAMDPDSAYKWGTGGGTSEEFKVLRYLAQLSVNIVDAIDSDDVRTRMKWYENLTDAKNPVREYVVGFELPRLVLNEIYAQYDNAKDSVDDTTDKLKADAVYNVNLWAELMNPIPDEAKTLNSGGGSLSGDCTATLQADATTPYYKILIIDGAKDEGVITNLANPLGDPDYDGPATTRILVQHKDWTGSVSVSPMDPASSWKDDGTKKYGFYVVGPDVMYRQAADDPKLPTTILSKDDGTKQYGMSYTIKATDVMDTTIPQPMLLLQRLANPKLPAQPDKSNEDTYNPFVTIDYVHLQDTEVNDGRTHVTGGKKAAADVPAMDKRSSWGRSQPLAAAHAQFLKQKPNPAVTDAPQHTFFRQNAERDDSTITTTDQTLKLPFDWLAHLDRIPVSPIELMTTSPHRSFDVLQYFVTGGGAGAKDGDPLSPGTPQQHIAPWQRSEARLYRFLEFCSTTTEPGGYWGRENGRIQGKININGADALELFQALTDQQDGNVFSDTDVLDLYTKFQQQRMKYNSSSQPSWGPTDEWIRANGDTHASSTPAGGWTLNRPLWSLGVGYAQASTSNDALSKTDRGILNTVLRDNSDSPAKPLFDVNTGKDATPPSHPYQKKEMLNKIFNSFTTRSNVFAVWMTAGFFRVEDATVIPPRLGEEYGKSENRHIRYRMFAIVDRTQMIAFKTSVSSAITFSSPDTSVTTSLNLAGGNSQTDSRTGRTFTIEEGTMLVYDPNKDYEETVTVQKDASGNLQATFKRPHGVGAEVICRGNPGPWSRYDPRQDTDVVRYFALID